MLLATAVPAKVSTVALVTPSPTVPLSGENEVMAGAPKNTDHAVAVQVLVETGLE